MAKNPFPDRHYLHFTFFAVNIKGKPENKEPNVCEGWEWFPLDNLPENLLDFCKISINAYLEKRNFTDS